MLPALLVPPLMSGLKAVAIGAVAVDAAIGTVSYFEYKGEQQAKINEQSYKDVFGVASGDEEVELETRSLDDVFENPLDRLQKELGDAVNEINATGGPGMADPASGGPPRTDPAQEAIAAAQAAEAEPETPNESMVVTANRTLPTLRGFTDQTFLLIHLANLINARNEKLGEASAEAADEDPSLRSTLGALKAELPYAYVATQAPNNVEANATIQCYGEPHTFLNYLTAYPGYQKYLDSSTTKLSDLTTKIRLFKVFHEDKREEAVEIVFDNEGISAGEVEELMQNGSKRGYGSGIKSFNITLDGTNPVTRTRSISATMVVYADSMETLLKPRRGRKASNSLDTSGLNYRYTDLAMKTDTVPGAIGGKDTDGSFGALDDLDYKIIAEVGISADQTTSTLMAGYTSMSISLVPIVHSYDIGQDGAITLSIDYKGYIEKEFSNPAVYDVFANIDSQSKDLAKQLGSHFLKKTCGSKAARSFNEKILAEGNAELKKRVASLLTKLRTDGKIYYIQIKEDVIQAYNVAFNSYEKKMKDAGVSSETGDKKKDLSPSDKKNIAEAFKTLQTALHKIVELPDEENPLTLSVTNSAAVEKEAKKIEKSAEDNADQDDAANLKRCAINPNSTQVVYFYAGDLINLILKNLSEVYSAQSSQLIINKATEILEADDDYKEIISAFESSVGPNGIANDILNASLGDFDEQQTAAFQDEVFEAIDEIQNKYADTALGMENLKTRFAARAKRFKKLRVVLGPTMFTNYFDAESPILCSIGDIPIPLNHFSAWLSGEVEGSDKYRFGLNDFLNKFINEYIRSYLMGDSKLDGGTIKQRKTYTSVPLVAYNPVSISDNDVLTSYRQTAGLESHRGLRYEQIPQDARPILDTTGNRMRATAVKEAYDYLIFHEKHVGPVFDKGKKANVLSYFGISMFQHGRDRGILKTAQYQTTNIQGRKEARFQKGKFNGLEQLTEVFDVTLNCYADLQIFPGHRLYLDGKSLVPYLSKKTLDSLNGYKLEDFGIGGYYIVNNVQHSFEQGKFETTIRAQWEQWQRNKDKKKSPEEEKYNPFSQALNEPIKEACKNSAAPDTGAASELFETAEEIARSIFGDEITSAVVGYIKGLSDVAASFFNGESQDDTGTGMFSAAMASLTGQTATAPEGPNPEDAPKGNSHNDGPEGVNQ